MEGRTYTWNMLQQDIRLDPQKRYATMNTHGLGWEILIENIREPNSPLAGAYHAIHTDNERLINDPYSVKAEFVEVSYNEAKLVYNAIFVSLMG